jgi:CubicO group peptidase (beta-lactamase class C family)
MLTDAGTLSAVPQVDDVIETLESVARERMTADLVPGAQLGIAIGSDGEVRSLGTSSLMTNQPTEDDTLFRIASITKVFTAALLARLHRSALVDLDVPVRRYVPEFDLADHDAARLVTTRHLLLHTGGFAVYQELVPSGPDALAIGARGQVHAEQIAPPGDLFNYNGIGYMVAGRVIEVVTGASYENALRTAVLGPLGMSRTKFATEPDDEIAGDHTVRDGAAEMMKLGDEGGRWPLPSGGLRSTAQDLLRFARSQFAASNVFDAGTRALMSEPGVTLPAPGESKALAWFVRELGGERMLLHLGGAPSQQSLLAVLPTPQVAVVVLTNSAVGAGVHTAVLARALELVFGIAQPPIPRTIQLSSDALAEYEGRFEGTESDLVVTSSDGGLALQVENKGVYAGRPTPPPAVVRFWRTDRAVGVDGWAKGQYGDFLRDDQGTVRYFRWGARVRRKAH